MERCRSDKSRCRRQTRFPSNPRVLPAHCGSDGDIPALFVQSHAHAAPDLTLHRRIECSGRSELARAVARATACSRCIIQSPTSACATRDHTLNAHRCEVIVMALFCASASWSRDHETTEYRGRGRLITPRQCTFGTHARTNDAAILGMQSTLASASTRLNCALLSHESACPSPQVSTSSSPTLVVSRWCDGLWLAQATRHLK